MQLGRVIGHATSTVKHPSMTGLRLLLIQPLNSTRESEGDPLLVPDKLGAGIGSIVIMNSDGRVQPKALTEPLTVTFPGIPSFEGEVYDDEADMTQTMPGLSSGRRGPASSADAQVVKIETEAALTREAGALTFDELAQALNEVFDFDGVDESASVSDPQASEKDEDEKKAADAAQATGTSGTWSSTR